MQMVGDPILPCTSKKLASLGVPWELPATNERCSGQFITREQEKKGKNPSQVPRPGRKGLPCSPRFSSSPPHPQFPPRAFEEKQPAADGVPAPISQLRLGNPPPALDFN